MKRVVLLGIVLSAPAWAGEEPAPVESLELETLLDLQVRSATKQLTPLAESPAVGGAFARGQIDDFDFLSLNDLVLTQPGFFPARDYERRTLGARGEQEAWNNNRLLLLIDGIPQNDVETGTAFTWEVTPLFMARSVEVLRSPGSALYGSYALHGMVSLETVSPADFGGSRALARLRVGPGTEVFDVMGMATSALADVVVAWNRFRTDGDDEVGIDASGRLDAVGAPMRQEIRDDHTSSTFFLKAEAKGALEGLTLSLQRQAWDYSTGRGWMYFTPDSENMAEWREVVSLRYRPADDGPWTQEYALQLQRHGYRLDAQLYPDGAFDGYYPDGVEERITTVLGSGFARAQLGRALPRGGQILAGIEYTGLVYDGDKLHTANVDMTDPEGPPIEGFMTLPPTYEPMVGHPVSKLAVFAQLTSGQLLGKLIELTAGVRFDDLFFDYTDVRDPRRLTRSHSFQDVSPRLAMIVHAADRLHLKLMAGRAFRTPTAVELFSANTWTAAGTDIGTLRAERQDTYELAVDWRMAGPIGLRSNVFVASLDNQIGYASDDESILNRLDDRRAGVENEVVFDARVGRTQLDGWLSWSFVTLLSEDATDPGLTSSDRVTRAPSHMGKLGARLRRGPFTATVQALYHGEVERRETDLVNEDNRAFRPDVLPAWVTVDAALFVRPASWARLGLTARNLTASGGHLASPGDLPFDYKVDDRRVLFELTLEP